MKRWGIKDEISLAAMHLLRIVISAVVMAIVLGIGGHWPYWLSGSGTGVLLF